MALPQATQGGFGSSMASALRPQQPRAPELGPPVEDSVVKHLDGILAKDSPLMERARTRGFQVANSRGLLNSSISAGAAMGEMIDRATPIAQQEASQGFGQNQQRREFEEGARVRGFQASETALERAQRLEEQRRSQRFTGQQNRADRRFQAGESALERQQRLEEQERDQTFTDQQNQREVRLRRQQAALDRDQQTRIANMNLDATERQNLSQTLSQMESLYASQYQAIMANTELSAEQRTEQIRSIENTRRQRANLVEQVYDVRITLPGLPEPALAAAPPSTRPAVIPPRPAPNPTPRDRGDAGL